MPILTIHTATYNRAYILHKAYESLKKQTNKNFEWIITDDGSTDGTSKLVSSWLEQDNGFDIIYNKLNHVGIPRALNSGVQHANTKWFMMLDSDDHILPETVDHVICWLKEIENKAEFAGIGFARCHPDGTFMKNQTPLIDPQIGYIDATHIERAKYNLNMDMCEVHQVALLRKYPFQYWETEKYAPEQLNFYEIALAGYKMRWRDEKLYICDYLPDGQTRDNKLVARNPMGFAMMYNQDMKCFSGFKRRFNDAAQMTALSFYAGHLEYLKKSNNIPMTILAFFPGLLLGLRRKKQFSNISL